MSISSALRSLVCINLGGTKEPDFLEILVDFRLAPMHLGPL